MSVMGLLLVVGVTLTLWWGGRAYETWEPGVVDGAARSSTRQAPAPRPSVRAVVLRYLRGVAVALVGGFWAGALVTGPAVRLAMRLLAVTAGDEAQGRLTEAEEVVGNIDLGGTIGLYLFGGIFPGLLSGALYVVFRRWLPSGRLGGVAFGALHLVLAATRIEPLRPGNPDFDLVGPGWLSVVTFGLASVLHGMAVVSIANRYSRSFPSRASGRGARARVVLPLVLPALILVPGAFLLLLLVAGLAITVAVSQVGSAARAARSRGVVIAGRLAVSVLAVALLPSTVSDVRDVIVRDDGAESPARETDR